VCVCVQGDPTAPSRARVGGQEEGPGDTSSLGGACQLRTHCYRALLEVILNQLADLVPASRAPLRQAADGMQQARQDTGEGLHSGGAGADAGDALRGWLRVKAEGLRTVRLAGVNREKVSKHSSFSSYARAVLRRASSTSTNTSTNTSAVAPPHAGKPRLPAGTGEEEHGVGAEVNDDAVGEELARLNCLDLDQVYGPQLRVSYVGSVLCYAGSSALSYAGSSTLPSQRPRVAQAPEAVVGDACGGACKG
jgi:hypothetical protein